MKRNIALTLAVIIAVSLLTGCGAIGGVVTDRETGAPLGGMMVEVYVLLATATSETLLRATQTNADGEYSYDLNFGNYTADDVFRIVVRGNDRYEGDEVTKTLNDAVTIPVLQFVKSPNIHEDPDFLALSPDVQAFVLKLIAMYQDNQVPEETIPAEEDVIVHNFRLRPTGGDPGNPGNPGDPGDPGDTDGEWVTITLGGTEKANPPMGGFAIDN